MTRMDDMERDLAWVAGKHRPEGEGSWSGATCSCGRFFAIDDRMTNESMLAQHAAHVAAEQMRTLRETWGLREETATLPRWVDSDPPRYWNHLTPDGPEIVRELVWEQKSRLVTEYHPTHPTEGDA